jgi:hypothetical protein
MHARTPWSFTSSQISFPTLALHPTLTLALTLALHPSPRPAPKHRK